jgi:hypothetical protein|tara:strand:- start:364 stop:552 length:189 start_codon:yes stop_codon:yes gene_type:complete
MKIKLKDKNSNLPNCWKQCGVSKEEWDKLKLGDEIDVKDIVVGIEHLVEKSPLAKKTVREEK